MKRIFMGLLLILVMVFPCACGVQGNAISENTTGQAEQQTALRWEDMQPVGQMPLSYATQFSVAYYDDGYALVTVLEDGKYLVVPEGQAVPQGLDANITVLKQPLNRIYLVSTSVMDLFRAIEGLDFIRLSGLKAEDWYISEARQAMEAGRICYAGKYSTPDYELILSEKCNLAIENTMIYHNPEVKEQLEQLGIPVLVERSSYESHPLGRMEWLKLYGLLIGKEKEAQAYFDGQTAEIADVLAKESTGKTVAFFYVTANGAVNVRKSGDYVAKMIELAGGSYVPIVAGESENALSTMNMQMEAFYEAAKDADYIIYNSTIDGELESLEDLYAKSELFRDFRAVKEGQVWCIGKNMFQESTGLGDVILDIHQMLTEENADGMELHYMYKLQ